MSALIKQYNSTKAAVIFGFITVFILVFGFGGWAYFSSISGAVIASGVVAVETNVKTVQHLDGGIISEILVKNGDEVKAGDLLIRLEDTNIKANLAILDGRLHVLNARKARLESERDKKDQILFPKELLDNANDFEIAKIIAGQKSLFEARNASMNGQKRLLRQKISQFENEIKGLEAQQLSKQKQAELIRQEITDITPLYKKGHVTRSRMLELERAVVQLDGEYGRHIGDIARVRGAIGQTELEILQLDKDYLGEIISELRDIDSNVLEMSEQKFVTVDRLNRIDIRSPRAGYIHNLAVHTIGGIVSPAEPVMQIIPDEDRLIIEAQVSPSDIDQIRLGQTALVRFSAFSSRTTPEMNGKVIKISPDSIVDRNSGMRYFQVIVEVADDELLKLGDNKLLPGMPAEAFIQTEERTALSYLLKPLMDNFNRAFREE